MKKIAIYPGSFDPITYGHLDIIARAADMFDELVVAVLRNSAKTPLFSVDERVNMIKSLTTQYKNVRVDSFDGLLVNYAREQNAHFLVRGLRAVTDFEYELQIAQTNRVEYDDIDTVFLATNLKYSYLSSTIVREFASYDGDISHFVPEEIIPLIREKYNRQQISAADGDADKE